MPIMPYQPYNSPAISVMTYQGGSQSIHSLLVTSLRSLKNGLSSVFFSTILLQTPVYLLIRIQLSSV